MSSAELMERDGDQIDRIASLPPQLAIMQMENDTIRSLAAAHPRNFATIKADLQSQLEAFPELAAEAVYHKPCGRQEDTCKKCGAECFKKKDERTGKWEKAKRCYSCKSEDITDGEMKYADGLSIRAAEVLAEAYGFNRVRADVTPIDEFQVKIEATFTDYQRGRIWQDGGIVDRRFKKKNGTIDVTPLDRFHGVVVKAEKSKYIRETINRSVNAGLKAWFRDQCEKISEGLLDDKTVEKIVAQFATKGATLAMLEGLLGKAKALGWNTQDRVKLLGVWNALKEGDTSLEVAFGIEQPDSAPKGNVNRSPLNDELAGGDESTDAHDGVDPPAPDDSSQAPPPPVDFAPLQAELAACEMVSDVQAVEKRWREAGAESYANLDWARLNEIVEARKEAIKAGRGGRSKQGTLA